MLCEQNEPSGKEKVKNDSSSNDTVILTGGNSKMQRGEWTIQQLLDTGTGTNRAQMTLRRVMRSITKEHQIEGARSRNFNKAVTQVMSEFEALKEVVNDQPSREIVGSLMIQNCHGKKHYKSRRRKVITKQKRMSFKGKKTSLESNGETEMNTATTASTGKGGGRGRESNRPVKSLKRKTSAASASAQNAGLRWSVDELFSRGPNNLTRSVRHAAEKFRVKSSSTTALDTAVNYVMNQCKGSTPFEGVDDAKSRAYVSKMMMSYIWKKRYRKKCQEGMRNKKLGARKKSKHNAVESMRSRKDGVGELNTAEEVSGEKGTHQLSDTSSPAAGKQLTSSSGKSVSGFGDLSQHARNLLLGHHPIHEWQRLKKMMRLSSDALGLVGLEQEKSLQTIKQIMEDFPQLQPYVDNVSVQKQLQKTMVTNLKARLCWDQKRLAELYIKNDAGQKHVEQEHLMSRVKKLTDISALSNTMETSMIPASTKSCKKDTVWSLAHCAGQPHAAWTKQELLSEDPTVEAHQHLLSVMRVASNNLNVAHKRSENYDVAITQVMNHFAALQPLLNMKKYRNFIGTRMTMNPSPEKLLPERTRCMEREERAQGKSVKTAKSLKSKKDVEKSAEAAKSGRGKKDVEKTVEFSKPLRNKKDGEKKLAQASKSMKRKKDVEKSAQVAKSMKRRNVVEEKSVGVVKSSKGKNDAEGDKGEVQDSSCRQDAGENFLSASKVDADVEKTLSGKNSLKDDNLDNDRAGKSLSDFFPRKNSPGVDIACESSKAKKRDNTTKTDTEQLTEVRLKEVEETKNEEISKDPSVVHPGNKIGSMKLTKKRIDDYMIVRKRRSTEDADCRQDTGGPDGASKEENRCKENEGEPREKVSCSDGEPLEEQGVKEEQKMGKKYEKERDRCQRLKRKKKTIGSKKENVVDLTMDQDEHGSKRSKGDDDDQKDRQGGTEMKKSNVKTCQDDGQSTKIVTKEQGINKSKLKRKKITVKVNALCPPRRYSGMNMRMKKINQSDLIDGKHDREVAMTTAEEEDGKNITAQGVDRSEVCRTHGNETEITKEQNNVSEDRDHTAEKTVGDVSDEEETGTSENDEKTVKMEKEKMKHSDDTAKEIKDGKQGKKGRNSTDSNDDEQQVRPSETEDLTLKEWLIRERALKGGVLKEDKENNRDTESHGADDCLDTGESETEAKEGGDPSKEKQVKEVKQQKEEGRPEEGVVEKKNEIRIDSVPEGNTPTGDLAKTNKDTKKEPEIFEVDTILKHAQDREGGDWYYVKWLGYSSDQNTWEPLEHLSGCSNLLKKFHRQLKRVEKTHLSRKRKLSDEGLVLGPKKPKLQKQSMSPVSTEAVQALVREELKNWAISLNYICTDTAPIVVENDVDFEGPPTDFTYINDYISGTGVSIPNDPLVGCQCTKCSEDEPECCPQNSGVKFAYNRLKHIRVKPGTPIYECNKYCKCGEHCPNRVVQLGRKYPMSIFRTSNGRGWGVKTLVDIRRNTFVMEYVGEVITNEEAERRGKEYDANGRTYLFDLDYNDDDCPFTVDAGKCGNISHFVNHSCEPNLVVYGVWVNCVDPRLPRIALFANRDIKAGEELTFDYQMTGEVGDLSPDVKVQHVACRCGADSCRGYLV